MISNDLRAIGKRINTQDGRSTGYPMYMARCEVDGKYSIVEPFFTHEACMEFIERHQYDYENLHEYVRSAQYNEEYQAIRSFLMIFGETTDHLLSVSNIILVFNKALADKDKEIEKLEFSNKLLSGLIADQGKEEINAIYGYCPKCGAKGVSREKRMNGNDKCENGHTYPSKDAHKELKEFKTITVTNKRSLTI